MNTADDPHTDRIARPDWEREKQRWHCLDCGVDTIECGHYYMVHDQIWAQSGCSPNGGTLCLCCLHRRLGRELTYEDFTVVLPSAQAWRDYVAWRERNHRQAEIV
jgi:hypothetical protein